MFQSENNKAHRDHREKTTDPIPYQADVLFDPRSTFEKAKSKLREEYRSADRFIWILLLAHVPASLLFSLGFGTWKFALYSSSVVAVAATLNFFAFRGTVLSRVLNSIFLMIFSGIFIQSEFGRIEMHFHIFGALAFLLIYKDWKTIVPPAGFIAVHHGLLNYCQENRIEWNGFPLTAFNSGSGWDVVLIHAIFVIFESVILVYYSVSLEREFLDHWRTYFEREEFHSANLVIQKSVQSKVDFLRKNMASMEESSLDVVDNSDRQIANIGHIDAAVENAWNNLGSVSRAAELQAASHREFAGLYSSFETKFRMLEEEIVNSKAILTKAGQHTRQSEESLGRMVNSIRKVSESYREMSLRLRVINDIAEKVNLLSLNASIEAARAGEQGRGFAVVADEISKLADQTAKTIKEIHNLISAGNEAMNDNTEIVRQGTHTISQVIEDVNEITDMTETFFETLREQTESRSKLSGIFERVIRNAGELETVIREQSSVIEEVKEASVSIGGATQLIHKLAIETSEIARTCAEVSGDLGKDAALFKN
ncbi:methyl-accepting chemotaxis protein [Leptospira ellisii]|uniref:Methyl-accepting chemotaxis protein n=2 Tax=Leptospira ellisii TaxID=2023197 RepID=A0A2N0B4K2_9LEPT|nr:methyl-accepting chemotaxis protein [Leptospira ellisii]MDV6237374.1 methyl-accepting chemotaxis protein [Leptospira ellisii]PJZ91481.1 hypothetical protein CH379_18445 [Leptospira ellisii]